MITLQALVTIVCFVRVVVGSIPEHTTNSLFSNATITGMVGNRSTVQGQFCCYVYPAQIALNKWYRNSTVGYVNETVITKYLQYNNTVVPTAIITVPETSTDLLGPHEAPLNIPGIPDDLAASAYGPDYYIRTVVLSETEYKDNFTVIPSPTPFMEYRHMYVFAGRRNSAGICMGTTGSTVYPATTVTNTFNSAPCTTTIAASTRTKYVYDVTLAASGYLGAAGVYNGGVLGPIGSTDPEYADITLDAPHYAVASQTDSWNQVQVMVDVRHDADDIRGKTELLAQYPDITLCELESGAGAPTVHIQASLLTSSSAVTSTTNAIFTKVATSSIASPASKAPSVNPTTKTDLESLRSNALKSSPSVQTDADSQSRSTKSSVGRTAISGSDVVFPTPESQESSSLKTPLTLDPTNTADTLRPTLSTSRTSETPKSVQGVALQTDLSGTTQTAAVQTSVPPSLGINSAQPQLEPSASTFPGRSIKPLTRSSDKADTTTPDYTLIPGKSSSFFVSLQPAPAGDPATTVPDDTEGPRHETSKDARTSNSHLVAADSAAATSSASKAYIASSSQNSAALLAPGTANSVSISDDNSRSNEQPKSVSSVIGSQSTLGATDSIIATPTSPETYVALGQTLVRGGSVVQISGNTYSLPTSGMGIAVDGQITAFYATVSGSPILRLGSQEITFHAIAVESTLKDTVSDSGGQMHMTTSTSNATIPVTLSTTSLPKVSASSTSLSNAATSQTQTANTIASTSSRGVSANNRQNLGMMFILGLILML